MFIGFARLPAGGGSHQRTRLGNQAERLILAFYSRLCARQGSDENLATAGRSAAGKLVSEVKSQSLQVDLM